MQYYRIVLGSEVRIAVYDKAMEVAAEMVEKAGGGVPEIKPCDKDGNLLDNASANDSTSQTMSVVSNVVDLNSQRSTTSQYSQFGEGKQVVDQQAKKRIEEMHRKLDIDSSEQLFGSGTRMAAEGYQEQFKRRKEHDDQVLLETAMMQLTDRVGDEIRRDFNISAKEVGKDIEVEHNTIYFREYALTEHAIRGLMTRIKSPAFGYIQGLQDRISFESGNYGGNQQAVASDTALLAEVVRYECLRLGDVECKIRAREYPQDVYAVLSPDFGVADAPQVIEQLTSKFPKDARGSWAYDPASTHWELRASIFTPTPVEEQSVGEPFQQFISSSSRDNGTSRFRMGGGINVIRCLNATIYVAKENSGSRVHKGKVLYDTVAMITRATKSMHELVNAWGVAREEEVQLPEKVTIEQAIPGFWKSLLSTKNDYAFAKILTGRKSEHIKGLSAAYFDQRRDAERIVKSDFTQSWTAYIQKQPAKVRREAEIAAGAFTVSKQKITYMLDDLDDME